jgi:hypothetical protein
METVLMVGVIHQINMTRSLVQWLMARHFLLVNQIGLAVIGLVAMKARRWLVTLIDKVAAIHLGMQRIRHEVVLSRILSQLAVTVSLCVLQLIS